MKIAVNTRLFISGKLEGVGWFAHEVTRRLVAAHPDHEFVFFFDRPFHPQYIFGKNVTPVVLFPPARHPFLFMWWFEWSVAKALKKYEADVFLSPDNFLTLRTDVPTVLVTHDLAHMHFPAQLPFFQKRYYRFFAPKFNRRADRIVAVSDFTKLDIVRQYGISPEKIAVGCNGCRGVFQPISEGEKSAVREQYSEGQPYFFYVGAVHPRKNVHRLIAAFDRFKSETNSPAKLLIAGRFAWKAGDVLDAFRQAKHQPDIRFLGFIEEKELARLMASAFALTYVSLFEGFGLPLLEAMHCEVPVITSATSSMPEIAGNAAILVDPSSVEAIADAMQQMWKDPVFCKKLVENGCIRRQLFTWERAAGVVWNSLQLAAGS